MGLRTTSPWKNLIAAAEDAAECIDNLQAENARLRAALETIANEDFRGNRPRSASIAEEALRG